MGSELIVLPVFSRGRVCAPDCASGAADVLAVELPDEALSSEGWRRGDYAIIDLTERPEDGRAGAVRARGEVVVGFIFYGAASDVFVISSDPELDGRHYLAGECEVLGVVARVCKSCERGECFTISGRSESALPPIIKLAQ